MNQGKTWEKISGDLTKGAIDGNVAFGTLTTLSESPLQFGLLYAGTDDGNLQVSKDGGVTWIPLIIPLKTGMSQNLWVSRVVASAHKKERVYCTLNGYRNDNLKVLFLFQKILEPNGHPFQTD